MKGYMRKNQAESEIVQLWREVERLKVKVESLEEALKNNKTTLSNLTQQANNEPVSMPQQVMEEWFLTESERKQLDTERKMRNNDNTNILPKH